MDYKCLYIYILFLKNIFNCLVVFVLKGYVKQTKYFWEIKMCYVIILIYIYMYINILNIYIIYIYIYIYIYVYNIDIYIYIYDFFLQIITNLSLQKVLNLLNLLCFGSCPKALQIVSQKSSLNFWMKELWALENHLLAIVTLLQLFHRGAVSIHWYIAQNI